MFAFIAEIPGRLTRLCLVLIGLKVKHNGVRVSLCLFSWNPGFDPRLWLFTLPLLDKVVPEYIPDAVAVVFGSLVRLLSCYSFTIPIGPENLIALFRL